MVQLALAIISVNRPLAYNFPLVLTCALLIIFGNIHTTYSELVPFYTLSNIGQQDRQTELILYVNQKETLFLIDAKQCFRLIDVETSCILQPTEYFSLGLARDSIFYTILRFHTRNVV